MVQHPPTKQLSPGLHATPHAPQLFESLAVSTQEPSQSARPSMQPDAPPLPEDPAVPVLVVAVVVVAVTVPVVLVAVSVPVVLVAVVSIVPDAVPVSVSVLVEAPPDPVALTATPPQLEVATCTMTR